MTRKKKPVEVANEFHSDDAEKEVYLSPPLPLVINRMVGYISDEEAQELEEAT